MGYLVGTGAMTPFTYAVSPTVGLNTLTVRVRSAGFAGLDPVSSPGGVAWSLSMTWPSSLRLRFLRPR